MKKIILTCLTIVCLTSFGQVSKKRAEKHFDNLSYAKAIELYEYYVDKHPNDTEAQLGLARSYAKINDPENAVKWYAKSIEDKQVDHNDYLVYAQMLSEVGNYQESKNWFEKYKNVSSKTEISNAKIAAIEELESFYKDSARYDIKNLSINSSSIEFAPAYYNNGILFSSSRSACKAIKLNQSHSWNESSFLDLFWTDQDTVLRLDKAINSRFHEGASYFIKKDSTLFFARNNFSKKNGKEQGASGINKIKLYKAEPNQGKWAINELPFNGNEYSTGDPFYFVSKNTLYFVSDREGGFGGTDIYKSVFENNSWSEPENLGNKINTPGNERTPYINEENKLLYFASDGHGGLGGLDVFVTDYPNEGNVENMGYPINTPKDDFGLIINKENKEGYLSSNRNGGKGLDDIYAFVIKEDPKILISGLIFKRREDQALNERKPLSEGIIEVWNTTENKKIDDLVADSEGAFSIALKKGAQYKFIGKKDTLIKDQKTIDLQETTENQKIELTLIELLPEPVSVLFVAKIIDEKTKDPVDLVEATLINRDQGKVQHFMTNNEGAFKTTLDPETPYLLKVKKNGYLTECGVFTTPTPSRNPHKLAQPIEIGKIELNKTFQLDDIYFDVNKWNIRPDAAKELDKVVAFLKDNPNIEVELGSHTDSRGSDAYNLSLSDKRANSSVDYIVSQGVPRKLILAKGYGEIAITNRCSNGVKCSKEEHQANRRTEIKIVGILDTTPELDKESMDAANQNTEETIEDGNCDQLTIVQQ